MSVFTNLLNAAKAAGYPPTDVSYSDMRAVLAYELDQLRTLLGGSGGGGTPGGIVLKASPLIDSFVEAGTANTPRVVFIASLKVMWAVFYAEPTNTKDILIGGSTVAASGVPVSPGQSYALPVNFDIHQLYVTSTANFQYRVLFAAAPV